MEFILTHTGNGRDIRLWTGGAAEPRSIGRRLIKDIILLDIFANNSNRHVHDSYLLLQSSIIPAKSNVYLYSWRLTPYCDPRKDLFKQFGIDLSFVATRSGLTRWEEHKEKDEFADEDEDAYDPDNPKDP